MPSTAMKPFKVHLRQAQIDALHSLAAKRGLSVSALIRQGIDLILAETPLEDDPLWNIIGLGNSGLGDLSVEHDRYLSGS